jgi:hypothetical protein
VLWLAAACSSTSQTARLESTSASIRAAEEVGARDVPQASLYLQLALEQSSHARQLIAEGDDDRAAPLLMRAQADAELAVALAREAAQRHEADVATARVQSLKSSR